MYRTREEQRGASQAGDGQIQVISFSLGEECGVLGVAVLGGGRLWRTENGGPQVFSNANCQRKPRATMISSATIWVCFTAVFQLHF